MRGHMAVLGAVAQTIVCPQTDTGVRAALFGAVLGGIAAGAATLAGSIIVERRKVTRQARIRLFDEIIPKLQATFRPGEAPPLSRTVGLVEVFQQLDRAGTI